MKDDHQRSVTSNTQSGFCNMAARRLLFLGGILQQTKGSIKKNTIPSSITSIGYSAFEGCSSLTQITIPSSVTSIGNSNFERCLSLKQITCSLKLNKPKIGISKDFLKFISSKKFEI